MKIGVALPQTDWPDGRVWSFAEIAEYGLRAEAAGFDSLWTNDHAFLELAGVRRPGGPDPFVLLAYLAGRTRRVELGTLVVCAPLRSPGQLAREAKALAELSGGRFVLGLGSGWHRPELAAFGLPHDHLVSRFEEYVEALSALLASGPVDYGGRYVTLRGAEVPGGSSPPLWIGASGARMLALTARRADGWNVAGGRERFAELLELLRREEAAAGRPEGSAVASAGASVLLAPPEEAKKLLDAHPPPFGRAAVGPEGLRALVDEQRAAGCSHLILHLSGGIWSSYRPEQLDLAAETLGLRFAPD